MKYLFSIGLVLCLFSCSVEPIEPIYTEPNPQEVSTRPVLKDTAPVYRRDDGMIYGLYKSDTTYLHFSYDTVEYVFYHLKILTDTDTMVYTYNHEYYGRDRTEIIRAQVKFHFEKLNPQGAEVKLLETVSYRRTRILNGETKTVYQDPFLWNLFNYPYPNITLNYIEKVIDHPNNFTIQGSLEQFATGNFPLRKFEVFIN